MVALALALVVVGLLLELRRRDNLIALERDAWRRTQAELLNRIKPEAAQPVEGGPEPELFQPAPLDSDDAYWEQRGVSNGRS